MSVGGGGDRTDTELIYVPDTWTDGDGGRGGAMVAACVVVGFVTALSGGAVGFILGLLLA